LNNPELGLLAIAWRHKRLVVGVTLLGLALTMAIGFLRPQAPRYLALATILIQEPINAQTVDQTVVSASYIHSQVEILNSPVVAEAARELVTENDPAALTDEELPETTIIGGIESPLVEIQVVARTTELAIVYVNAVAESYREVSQRQAIAISEARIAHIDAQVESIDERLHEIGQAVAEFVGGDEGLAELRTQAEDAVAEISRLQTTLVTNQRLSDAEAAAIRQRIQDYGDVMAVYQEALAAASSNPALRAFEEEQAQQVDRRATLLTLRDQIDVGIGLGSDGMVLVQPASTAVQLPVVDLARLLGVGLVLGAAAGLGLARFLSVSRRIFSGRFEPEQLLGVPLLADIPDFQHEVLKSSVPVLDHPRSVTAETFRFASSTLDVAARGRGAHSIFLASSTLGRGKTTTAVNLAVAAAVKGRSVLVMDCDFGNQRASSLLAGNDHGSLLGMTDVIEADTLTKEATHEIELTNGVSLDLMPRGTRPSPAATTLQSSGARRLFTLIAGEYDLVVIDGPPMLQVAYAATLAELADAVVVVTEHESRQSELAELKNRLDLVKTPVLGYVYNRSPLRREMTMSEGSMMDILGDSGLSDGARLGSQRSTG
jgi:polysaccharide biosynthesis transport protein